MQLREVDQAVETNQLSAGDPWHAHSCDSLLWPLTLVLYMLSQKLFESPCEPVSHSGYGSLFPILWC
jgi:hypothetical protein